MSSNQRPDIDRKRIECPRLRIDVTKELIEKAIRSDSSHCMISMAVAAAMPLPGLNPTTDIQTIRLTDRELGYRFTYLTPRIAQEALIQFDWGIDPQPFQFTLANPVHIGYSEKPAAASARDRKRRIQYRPGVSRLDGTRTFAVIGGPSLPTANVSDSLQARGLRRQFGLRQLRG
jgi:hypothetical protein